jgi:hypothetical protein
MKNMIVTIALILIVTELALAEDISRQYAFVGRTFKLDVTQEWTNTGYSVVSGRSYSLILRGVASTNGTSDWTGPAGDFEIASGGVGFLLPGWPSMSVIGKIGSSGTAFYVGDQLNFTANVSGTLYLGYNDRSGVFYDNAGYFVAFLTGDHVTAVDEANQSPTQLSLEQNYPNPFNPSTTIRYSLPNRSHVVLTIFNALGQQVTQLVNDELEAGYHEAKWDASSLSSGVYFYRLQVGSFVDTKRLMLLK